MTGMIFIGGSLVLQYYKMVDGMTPTIILGVGISLVLNAFGIDTDKFNKIIDALKAIIRT